MTRLTIRAAILATSIEALVPDKVAADPLFIAEADAASLVRAVHLYVDDQIHDKCWTNATTIESKIRLMFEREGVKVYRDELLVYPPFFPAVRLFGLGGRSENGFCFGLAVFEVSYYGFQDWGETREGEARFTVGEPYGVRNEGWISLSSCHPNRQQARTR